MPPRVEFSSLLCVRQPTCHKYKFPFLRKRVAEEFMSIFGPPIHRHYMHGSLQGRSVLFERNIHIGCQKRFSFRQSGTLASTVAQQMGNAHALEQLCSVHTVRECSDSPRNPNFAPMLEVYLRRQQHIESRSTFAQKSGKRLLL